jgi:quercetin dioxygenase-like cupin family protein
MQNKILYGLASLKQLFKKGVAFLMVILLFFVIFGCQDLRVDKPLHKIGVVELNPEIEVQQLIKSGLSWNNAVLPAYPAGDPEITILRIRVAPGGILTEHKHPVINAGVLIKGELTVQTIDGKTLHLKPGNAIVETVDTWHYGKNEGAEPAEIIVFYSGVKGAPITIGEK